MNKFTHSYYVKITLNQSVIKKNIKIYKHNWTKIYLNGYNAKFRRIYTSIHNIKFTSKQHDYTENYPALVRQGKIY